MPIPEPTNNERKEDFVSRCHSALSAEYTDQDQRHAICMDAWRGKNKKDGKRMVEKRREVQKAIKKLNQVIKAREKEIIYKSIIDEIPMDAFDLFSGSGKVKMKQVYLQNRLAGVEKSEALNLSVRLVARSFKNNKMVILKGIEKTLTKIRDRILKRKEERIGDGDNQEFPIREEIPVIDEDAEDSSGVEIDKGETGETSGIQEIEEQRDKTQDKE